MSTAVRLLSPLYNSLKSNLLVSVTSKNDLIFKKFSSDSGTSQDPPKSDGEKLIMKLLRERFPNAKEVEASDISGGCGSMYAVYVETEEFKNTRKIKQHKMVQDALKEEIKNMHGIRVQTAVPGEQI
jgi:stress-induced morphogen